MSSNAPAPLALKKFLGVKRLTKDASNFGFVGAILQLMEIHRPHVHPGSRNVKAAAVWQLIIEAFFDHSQSAGRSFVLPNPVKAKYFSKEVTSNISIFASQHQAAVIGVLPHSALQANAFSIQEDTRNALDVHIQRVTMSAAAKAARTIRLAQGQGMIGLNPPGRGILFPSLPNSLTITPGQQQGLAVLGRPTQSLNYGEYN